MQERRPGRKRTRRPCPRRAPVLLGQGGARRPAAGFTALELLLVVSIVATLAGVGLPLLADAADEVRTAMAARYLEGRIVDARMHAIRRSAPVALRFEPAGGGDYRIAEYTDGNGNGVRTGDIASGADPQLAAGRLLREQFSGVSFGLEPGVPDVDGVRSASRDGVRIGASRILSLGPDGTATSGTLYLQGRRGRYAVRVLGATARTRVFRFDRGGAQWIAR